MSIKPSKSRPKNAPAAIRAAEGRSVQLTLEDEEEEGAGGGGGGAAFCDVSKVSFLIAVLTDILYTDRDERREE